MKSIIITEYQMSVAVVNRPISKLSGDIHRIGRTAVPETLYIFLLFMPLARPKSAILICRPAPTVLIYVYSHMDILLLVLNERNSKT